MSDVSERNTIDFLPEKHARIINAHLESGMIEISATDWMASPAFEPKLGNMSALFVTGTDGDELKSVFDELAGQSESGFRNCGRCRSSRMDSLTTSMACSGSSEVTQVSSGAWSPSELPRRRTATYFSGVISRPVK